MCAGCVTGVMYCLWYLMDVSDVCCVFMGLTYLFCVGCGNCACFMGRMLLFAMCVCRVCWMCCQGRGQRQRYIVVHLKSLATRRMCGMHELDVLHRPCVLYGIKVLHVVDALAGARTKTSLGGYHGSLATSCVFCVEGVLWGVRDVGDVRAVCAVCVIRSMWCRGLGRR